MNPNMILIGAPGSGKGTQSEKLIKQYSYGHISTGDLLRAEIAKASDLGKRVSSILAKGELVDDGTVMELMASRCDLNNNFYIFDGFPRNIAQANLLQNFLSTEQNNQMAIYLKVDIESVVKRISLRRVCKCGQVYSLASTPDAEKIACTKCGNAGTIIQRKDDMPEVVETRLKIFADTIEPMLEYYKSKQLLHVIDASLTEELVFKNISDLIDNFRIK